MVGLLKGAQHDIQQNISIWLLPLATFADNTYQSIQTQRDAEIRKYLISQNLPLPDDGVQIIPAKSMENYPLIKNYLAKKKRGMIQQGYVEEYNPRAKELIDFPITSAHQYKKQATSLSSNADLVHNIHELKIAFTFTGVPSSDIKTIYGYAPTGSYLPEGWTGAVEFFEFKENASCVLSVKNVKVSHGSVRIAKEDARDDVNGKVTTIDVSGNQQSGFVYTVSWFDSTYFRDLECATKLFSSNTTHQTIELAKRIDSN